MTTMKSQQTQGDAPSPLLRSFVRAASLRTREKRCSPRLLRKQSATSSVSRTRHRASTYRPVGRTTDGLMSRVAHGCCLGALQAWPSCTAPFLAAMIEARSSAHPLASSALVASLAFFVSDSSHNAVLLSVTASAELITPRARGRLARRGGQRTNAVRLICVSVAPSGKIGGERVLRLV